MLSIVHTSGPPHSSRWWVPLLSPYDTTEEETQKPMRVSYLSTTTQEVGSWSKPWLGEEDLRSPHGTGLSPLSCQSNKHLSEWPRNYPKQDNETTVFGAASLSQTLGGDTISSGVCDETPGRGGLTSIISRTPRSLSPLRSLPRLS